MRELLCAEQGPGNGGEQIKVPWCSHLALVQQCRPERLQDCSASCSLFRGGHLESVSPEPGLQGTHGEGHPWETVSDASLRSCPLPGDSSRWRRIQQTETCLVCLSATRGLVLCSSRAGACLPLPLNTQLLFPSAHTCPLLVTCTDFFTFAYFLLDLAVLFLR